MTDIIELIKIINSYNGSASIDKICETYCVKHHVIIEPHLKTLLHNTLLKHPENVFFDSAKNEWQILTKGSDRIEQAMLQWDNIAEQKDKEIAEHYEDLRYFQKLFPPEYVSDMPIDKYAMHSGRKDTFCYYIGWDRSLLWFASMGQPQANWFGVYWNKGQYTTGRTSKFGSDPYTAYENVRNEIVKLITAGKSDDYDTIRESLLGNKIRDKILWAYYPEKYLPFFSNDFANAYLDIFGIPYHGMENGKYTIDKKRLLIEWRDSHYPANKWSTACFEAFLDNSFMKKDWKIGN